MDKSVTRNIELISVVLGTSLLSIRYAFLGGYPGYALSYKQRAYQSKLNRNGPCYLYKICLAVNIKKRHKDLSTLNSEPLP